MPEFHTSIVPSLPKVVVLMGGPSEEHDISLKSGHGAAHALQQRGFHVESVAIPRHLSVEDAASWTRAAIQRAGADVVFIALHGAFGEDGTIQQVCEELHVAYTGSDAAASRLGMDKIASRQRFIQAGLDVPRWRALPSGSRELDWLDGWRFPLVVKPSAQGSSIGVSVVHDRNALPAALEEAGRHGTTVLIEAFVKGRELTVGVLGEQALPIVEVIPKTTFFDFTAKYTVGMTEYHVPAVLDEPLVRRVQDAGLRAHQATGCRHFSRTDLILDASQRPVILEVNTIPGLTPTSLLPKAASCLGLSYETLCEQLVQMAWHGSSHLVRAVS